MPGLSKILLRLMREVGNVCDPAMLEQVQARSYMNLMTRNTIGRIPYTTHMRSTLLGSAYKSRGVICIYKERMTGAALAARRRFL